MVLLWVVLAGAAPAPAAGSAAELVAEARAYLAKGERKAAEIQLKNALQADPTHVDARLLLAAIYLGANDPAGAAKEFARARDLGAAADDWMPGYAQALMLQGDYPGVLETTLDDAALAAPQRAAIAALRGNAHLGLQQVDEAIAAYDRALALAPGNTVARLGKARILLARGELDEALQQLGAVLRDDPGHLQSRLTRGDVYRRLQQLDAAAVDYEAATEAAPNDPRAFMGLALVHIAQRDVAAARQDLAALDRLTRDLPAVDYLHALVAFLEQDFDRAAERLQSLLRAAPSNLQAQTLYGIVSYARGEFTIADDYLTRVFASVPGNLQVAKLLGAARLKLRQPDRAIEVLAPLVDETTDDAQLLALLGTAYLQNGDNSQGAVYIQRAVELDPEQALLRTQLAVGRIAAGDTTGAIAELESAVALGQDVLQADVLLVLSYLNRQQFERALEAATALEQRMADSPIPYNLTGLAYLAQRLYDEAAARFELALEKDPAFLVARMNLARLAIVAERPAEAVAAYRRVLDQDPAHLGAMLGLASLARQQGDDAAFVDWLTRANEANPQALQPILLLAERHLRDNEGLKANSLLISVPPQQADRPAVLRLRGMAQLQSGEYANAVHTLRKLVDQQPDAIEAWFQLARAQAASDDAAAARASFARAIELDAAGEVPLVWIGLGELELRERQFDAALAAAQQIRQRFPDNVHGYDIQAAALRGLGRTDEALEVAGQALQLAPSSRRVNAFASQLAAARQAPRATAVLLDWLSERPDDGTAWSNLGMLYQQQGAVDDAVAAYERALANGVDNPVILNNLAWLYLERDPQRAAELATRAYELAPTRAEIVDTYGWVLFQTGRRSEGLAALQQASIIAPRNAEITLHVAEALHLVGRDAEARPMLERLLREQPSGGFADAARQLLGRLGG